MADKGLFESTLYKWVKCGRYQLPALEDADLSRLCKVIKNFENEIIALNTYHVTMAIENEIPMVTAYDIREGVDLEEVIQKLKSSNVLTEQEFDIIKEIVSVRSKYVSPIQIFARTVTPVKKCKALEVKTIWRK